jgi:hypothetical protein
VLKYYMPRPGVPPPISGRFDDDWMESVGQPRLSSLCLTFTVRRVVYTPAARALDKEADQRKEVRTVETMAVDGWVGWPVVFFIVRIAWWCVLCYLYL